MASPQQTESPKHEVKWRATYGSDVSTNFPPPPPEITAQHLFLMDQTQKSLDAPPSKNPPVLTADEQQVSTHLRNLVFHLNEVINKDDPSQLFWTEDQIKKYLDEPKDAASLAKIIKNVNSSLAGTNLRLAIEAGSERKLWVARYDDKQQHFYSFCVVDPPEKKS